MHCPPEARNQVLKRRAHLEVLVGEAGPGRGGLGRHVLDALGDVGRVVVLPSAGAPPQGTCGSRENQHLRSLRSEMVTQNEEQPGCRTHRFRLISLGDLQELRVDLSESVHSSLESLVLGRQSTCGNEASRMGRRGGW